jgi:hypothetical protein
VIDKVVEEQTAKISEVRKGIRNTAIGVQIIKDKIVSKKKASDKLKHHLKCV